MTQSLGYILLVSAIAFQLSMLFLQARSYRRHRHLSFLLLSISTSAGILYLGVGYLPRVLPDVSSELATGFRVALLLLLLVQLILGFWGTASLFQSYRQLTAELSEAKTRGNSV